MSVTVTREITLIDMQCGECDLTFAVPDYWRNKKRQTGETFYCPNGHPRCYRDSDNTKLEKRISSLESTNTHLRDQAEAAARANAALKGQITKARKRASNGVCPCCKRTFANVARHMNSKHPDFDA